VASEVRALAQRSVDAIKEIKGLILASSAQASEGVALIAKTGEALQRIERKASEIDAVVSNIASWAQKQAAGIAQVSAAAGRRDEVARQSAALVEQTIVASRRLGNDSRKLSSLIGQFRFQNCAGESLRRELKSLAPHAFQDRAELPESAGDRDPVASWSPPIRSIGPAIGESSPPNASNGRREGRTAASSGAGTGDGAVPDRRTGGTWKEF